VDAIPYSGILELDGPAWKIEVTRQALKLAKVSEATSDSSLPFRRETAWLDFIRDTAALKNEHNATLRSPLKMSESGLSRSAFSRVQIESLYPVAFDDYIGNCGHVLK